MTNNNWVKGVKGFKQALDTAQRQELLYVWQPTWDYQMAKDFLKSNYSYTPNRKTLYVLRKKLMALWVERDKNPDMEVDWSDRKALEMFSKIPSSDFDLHFKLHGIWERVQQLHDARKLDAKPFTYRTLKWTSHIRNCYSNTITGIPDILHIANSYAIREMVSDWDKSEFQRTDLDKWLLYKPWYSRKKMEYYLRLIDGGEIPELNAARFKSGELEIAWELLHNDKSQTRKANFIRSLFNFKETERIFKIDDAIRYLLPTQRF